jgi:hypothetical protein
LASVDSLAFDGCAVGVVVEAAAAATTTGVFGAVDADIVGGAVVVAAVDVGVGDGDEASLSDGFFIISQCASMAKRLFRSQADSMMALSGSGKSLLHHCRNNGTSDISARQLVNLPLLSSSMSRNDACSIVCKSATNSSGDAVF